MEPEDQTQQGWQKSNLKVPVAVRQHQHFLFYF